MQDIQFGNRKCEENNQAGHKHYRNNQDVHEGRFTDLCIQKICKQDKEDIKIIKKLIFDGRMYIKPGWELFLGQR